MGSNFSKRALIGLIVLLAAVVVLHRPLLRLVAHSLVVDRPRDDFTAVVIAGGDGRYREAARLLRLNPAAKAVILEKRDRRLTAMGILPRAEKEAIDALQQHGIVPDRIVVLPVDGRGSWRGYRAVGLWLNDDSQRNTVVLTEQLSSRRVQMIYDRVLTGGASQRLSVRALPNREFDLDGWWTSRTAWKAVFSECLDLAFLVVWGEDHFDEVLSPDEYEHLALVRWGLAKS